MNDRGIWDNEEHRTGHTFSYRLAEFIHNLIPINQIILDFGCGRGTYVKYLRDVGHKNTYGIEGLDHNYFEIDNPLIRDLSKPILCAPGNVISIEVGEHISKEYESTFIDNIAINTRKGCYLIISWAHEGQDGYGHVNCLPDWKVIELFTAKGFELQNNLTESVRSVVEGHVAYLKENLFIFKKIKSVW